MYKKFALLLLIISPILWTVFVGIPVRNARKSNSTILESQRCYATGDTRAYLDCLLQNQKLRDGILLQDVVKKLNQEEYGFGYAFLVLIISQLVMLPFLLQKRQQKEK